MYNTPLFLITAHFTDVILPYIFSNTPINLLPVTLMLVYVIYAPNFFVDKISTSYIAVILN